MLGVGLFGDGPKDSYAPRLVITTVLRAYQAGARAADRACLMRGQLDPELLSQMARDNRERARATDRSARLLLAHIHQLYNFPRSKKAFVDNLRRYPVEVIEKAERALRDQVNRDDIRDRQSYFAKLVRVYNDQHQAELRREQHHHHMLQHLEDTHDQDADREKKRRADSASFLRQALTAVADMWWPEQQSLLFDGAGLGRAYLRLAARYCSSQRRQGELSMVKSLAKVKGLGTCARDVRRMRARQGSESRRPTDKASAVGRRCCLGRYPVRPTQAR